MIGRIALVFSLACCCQAADDAVAIVRRSVQVDQRTLERAKDYTFQQTTVERDLDSEGRVKSTESKTYDVLMLYGRAFRKLVAKNGAPLPPAERQKEESKLQKELDKRRSESPEERARNAREDEKERNEIRRIAAEIPNACNLRLVGDETVQGRRTWVIEAEPKPNYTPKESKAKFITKMRGKLWIDKTDYHWARVESEPIDTISFGWVLARLSPGTKIEIEQMRVNDEIWAPSHIRIRLNARLALLKTFRKEIDVSYRDFRKFQTDSRVVAVAEKSEP